MGIVQEEAHPDAPTTGIVQGVARGVGLPDAPVALRDARTARGQADRLTADPTLAHARPDRVVLVLAVDIAAQVARLEAGLVLAVQA
jgi:hypothetical protein